MAISSLGNTEPKLLAAVTKEFRVAIPQGS